MMQQNLRAVLKKEVIAERRQSEESTSIRRGDLFSLNSSIERKLQRNESERTASREVASRCIVR